MKELSKKTFFTIFSILSIFLLISTIIINTNAYVREYNNINRSVTFIESRGFKETFRLESNNTIFTDYDLYTVIINNKKIDDIFYHGRRDVSLDIESIAENIINTKESNTIKIGNLYFNKYAYNYVSDNLLIVTNITSSSNKLIILLLESIIVVILGEILIYMISNNVTKWIIKPASESFKKQKEFIADASHELKTPLAVIMASAEEIKENKTNSKYVENIKYESERMNNLILNMLELSKLEEGITRNSYKEENLSKIVEKSSLTFEAIAFEKEVTINNDIEKDIKFNSSKDEIEKLVGIIIDNAVKHSYSNTTIDVKLYSNKNNIILTITNEGDPINKEDEEKIFERFYRIDKARNRNENRYGLGLAIAKSIVTNHGGTISAHSENNKTTFKIVFTKKER